MLSSKIIVTCFWAIMVLSQPLRALAENSWRELILDPPARLAQSMFSEEMLGAYQDQGFEDAKTSCQEECLKTWKLTFSNDLVSQALWRGSDYYVRQDPVTLNWVDQYTTWAWQPSLDLTMGQTGLGLNIWGTWSMESGYAFKERLDYTLYYKHLLGGDLFEVNLAWAYRDYYHLSSRLYDSHDLSYGLKFLGCPLVKPFYEGYGLFPLSNEVLDGGSMHQLGATYDWPMPCWQTWCTMQRCLTVNVAGDIWYDDGVWRRPSGWSHSTFTIGTRFDFPGGLSFVPSCCYQFTLKRETNPDYGEINQGIAGYHGEDEFVLRFSLVYTLPLF